MQEAVREKDQEERRIGQAARAAQNRINREVPGSQQQRALVRQYGTPGGLLEQYHGVRKTLDRDLWLKRSMKGLGAHMRRRALIYKDDVPTFPLDIDV